MKQDRAERFESRFQSYLSLGGPSHGAERTRALRAEFGRLGLAGFIVPRADRQTPIPDWKRSEWACDVLPHGDPARDEV